MDIVWTVHALDRAMERIGPDESICIPYESMRLISKTVELERRFRLWSQGVVYVLKRSGESLFVITVYRSKGNARRNRVRNARVQKLRKGIESTDEMPEVPGSNKRVSFPATGIAGRIKAR